MFGHSYTGGKVINNNRKKSMIKNIFKKALGIDKIEAATQQAVEVSKAAIDKIEKERQQAVEAAKEAIDKIEKEKQQLSLIHI